MKYTVSEFAQEIRKMYPGDYNDLSDSKLVELWLKKYPNDRKKIQFSNTSYSSPFSNKNDSNKSSGSFGWIFVLISVIVLAATNPSEDRHVSEVKGMLKKYVNKKVSSSGGDLFGFGSIISGLGNMVIDSQLDQFIKRKNYFLFSLTSIKFDNKEEVIGWGILGNVYMSDKVEQELDKLYNKGADVIDKFGSGEKKSENNSQTNNYKTNENSETALVADTNYYPENNTYQSSTEQSIGYYYVLASENSRVYIYSSPDPTTRKDAYFSSQERVYVNEFKNGFGYMEFTNSENKTSTGWLRRSELRKDN